MLESIIEICSKVLVISIITNYKVYLQKRQSYKTARTRIDVAGLQCDKEEVWSREREIKIKT